MFSLRGCSLLVASANAFTFKPMHIDQPAAAAIFDELVKPAVGQVNTWDFSFDVDCNENEDNYCHEYCLFYCAIPQQPGSSFEDCQKHLPVGCNARYGGMRVTKAVMGPEQSAWRKGDSQLGKAWSLDLTSARDAVMEMLDDFNVEFSEVFIGMPPKPSDQTWTDPGKTEPEIDEGVANKNVCNTKKGPGSSAFTSVMTAFGLSQQTEVIGGAIESRGLQANGMYASHRGWRLFQGYLGPWEAEIFKLFYMIPMDRKFLIDDLLFKEQLIHDDKGLILLSEFFNCMDATTAGQTQFPFTIIFPWTKLIQGAYGARRAPGESLPYDDWTGYPIPRYTESCVKASTCETCELQVLSGGAGNCSWCMTALGQSCEAECGNIYAQHLACHDNSSASIVHGSCMAALVVSLALSF